MIRRPPRSTLFPTRRSSDLMLSQPVVLIVAPLSGHYATLLRDTVQSMLGDHKVYITDWKNARSEEHTSELQSLRHLVCRLLLEKKKKARHRDGQVRSGMIDK